MDIFRRLSKTHNCSWFVPMSYSLSTSILDLGHILRKNWGLFNFSKHSELRKFKELPTLSVMNSESLGDMVDKVDGANLD